MDVWAGEQIEDNDDVSVTPINAVILAGGSGTRLWPLSRKHVPKQYLSVDGGEVLLKATVNRLSPFVGAEDVLVVTNEQHASGEAYQTLSQYEKLLEPVPRNTAPAIALAAAWLNYFSGEDPVMVVLPADHVIRNQCEFHKVLNVAIQEARSGSLVTFGITPTRADTGFGYIQTKVDKDNEESVLKAVEFKEKPDKQTAERYLEEGSYYWNSGMFVWKASVILSAIRKHLPDVVTILDKITDSWREGEFPQLAVDKYFPDMPDISIDYGVLEKVPNHEGLVVIPSDIAWSDVGSWDAVHEILPKDKDNNAIFGNALNVDCKNTLIHSNKRLVAAVGVDDLCIVETSDAVLVVKRGETQRVREVVDALKETNAQEHILHPTVRRPWGSYTVLEEHAGFKMKRITVEPGHSLSLQRHQHRSEHWIVVSGTATILCDGESRVVTKNQSTYIPIGSTHRLENRGKIPLQLIEVQVGEYLGEDDIERFEDMYGRRQSDGISHD